MALDKSILVKRKAQSLVRDGRIQQAIEELRKILGETEADPYDHVYLGDLLYRKGDLAEAVAAWSDAVAAYERVGLYRNAIAICKKVLRIDPQRFSLKRTLGDLLLREGLSGDAIQPLLEYLSSQSGPPPVPPEFTEILDKVAALTSLPAEAALQICDHFRRLGQPERAFGLLSEVAAEMARTGNAEAAELLHQRLRDLGGEVPAAPIQPPVQALTAPPALEPSLLDEWKTVDLLGDLDGALGPAAGSDPGSGSAGGPAAEGPQASMGDPASLDPMPGDAFVFPGEPDRGAGEPAPEPPAGEAEPSTASLPECGIEVEHFPLPEAEHHAAGWRLLLAQGEEALATDRWSEARARFEQVLHERPLDRTVLPKLVEIARKLEDRAAEIHYWTLLGDSWIEDGDLAEALKAFMEVLRIDPEDSTACRRISRFREMGVAGAEEVPEETHRSIAAVLETSDAHVSVAPDNGGIRSEEWVDLEALLEEFKSGVKNQIDGDDFRSHYDLALSHRSMGLLEEAVEELDQVLACSGLPRSTEWPARELKGVCLADLNRSREAIHEFREALIKVGEEQPGRCGILYHLGCALESAEEWAEAEEVFQEIVGESPSYRDAADHLRRCREQAGPPQARREAA